MSEEVKINIGCGRFRLPGFINVDAFPDHGPDVVADALDYLGGLKARSVDFIYAGHFLEHLPFKEGNKFLWECARVLRPGCWVQITVPDTEKAFEMKRWGRLNFNIDLVALGSQENEYEYHHRIFSRQILRDALRPFFTEVQEVDFSPYWPANVEWQTCMEARN